MAKKEADKKRSLQPIEHDKFLKSYGMHVAVLLAGIIILVALGFANPSQIFPEACNLELGLNCKSFRIDIDANVISLVLQNSLSDSLIIHEMEIKGDDFINCNSAQSYRPFNEAFEEKKGWIIRPEEGGRVTINCDDVFPSGGKVKAAIFLKWTNADAHELFTHSMHGQILATPKQGKVYCCCRSGEQLDYDIWIEKSVCDGSLGTTCTSDTFHSCNILQERCCKKGNHYFWGDELCSGIEQGNFSSEKCEY